MQVDDVAAAGRLVQAVDVLRHELRDAALRFECRERAMRVVRPCREHAPESDEAARPVAFTRMLVRDEVLEHDRPAALPFAVGVAVIGNAGGRAAAGARQHEQSFVPLDELAKRGAAHRLT